MFWNNRPPSCSLKTRTALLYAGLFAVSFAVIFAAVWLCLFFGNRESADRRLNEVLGEFEYEYLTGEEFSSVRIPVRKFRKIPEKVFLRTADELPGFRTLLAFRDAENSGLFTLFGLRGRELWQITVDADSGRLEKKQIAFADRAAVLAEEFAERSGGEGARMYFLLRNSEGKILARSPMPDSELECFQKLPNPGPGEIRYSALQGTRRKIRTAELRLFDGAVLTAGTDQHEADENLDRVVTLFLASGLTVLVLSALAGWLLARGIAGRIDRIGQAADRIAAGDYSQRVPPGSGGLELDRLAASFNTMAGNTEKLMGELRTIADDIAHDLRTPLTRMLGRAEVTVSGKPGLEACLDTLGDNAEECRRMLSLINRMLDISKTESGACILHKKEVDLAALLNHSAELFRMVTELKKQTLTVETPTAPVMISADPMRIQQLIANLLDNASKFTPEGGSITASAEESTSEVRLRVSDTGCGIPESEREKVFRRFYRADASRNLPGNGLGLAMVQAVAHAHGGTVGLESEPGKGSTFTVRFPKK